MGASHVLQVILMVSTNDTLERDVPILQALSPLRIVIDYSRLLL